MPSTKRCDPQGQEMLFIWPREHLPLTHRHTHTGLTTAALKQVMTGTLGWTQGSRHMSRYSVSTAQPPPGQDHKSKQELRVRNLQVLIWYLRHEVGGRHIWCLQRPCDVSQEPSRPSSL